jgi:hypothetical protein
VASAKLTVEMENDDGQRTKKTFWLDPLTFNMSQSRAHTKEYDSNGRCTDIKPHGPAWLHLYGAIEGASNESQG